MIFSAYGNYWTTLANGSLSRYLDYNEYTGEWVELGTSGVGPVFANETIHAFVDGRKIGDYVTDSKGLFYINTDDLGEFETAKYVNMNFSVDFMPNQASQQKRVFPKGYTEVGTVSYAPNNLSVSLSPL